MEGNCKLKEQNQPQSETAQTSANTETGTIAFSQIVVETLVPPFPLRRTRLPIYSAVERSSYLWLRSTQCATVCSVPQCAAVCSGPQCAAVCSVPQCAVCSVPQCAVCSAGVRAARCSSLERPLTSLLPQPSRLQSSRLADSLQPAETAGRTEDPDLLSRP